MKFMKVQREAIVWLKLAIYCGSKWAGNPDTGSKCRPPGNGQVMGGLCEDAGGSKL